MPLFAFTGPIGAGKTTAAQVLVDYGYTRVSFADPLKKMLLALGLSYEELYGSEKETPCGLLGGRTPRYAMQTLGTEWGRSLIHPNLWVNAWCRRVQVLARVVVDDARFPNEFAAIESLKGMIFDINRKGFLNTVKHESEIHRPSSAISIANDGSLEDFKAGIVQLCLPPPTKVPASLATQG